MPDPPESFVGEDFGSLDDVEEDGSLDDVDEDASLDGVDEGSLDEAESDDELDSDDEPSPEPLLAAPAEPLRADDRLSFL